MWCYKSTTLIRFDKKYLEELYYAGMCSNKKHRYQPQVIKEYIKCVKILDKVKRIEDLFQFHYKPQS